MSKSYTDSNISVQIMHHLAEAVLDRYGHEGLQAVKQAVTEFGHKHGKQVRLKVEALGLAANLENFLRYNGIYEQNSFLVEQTGDAGRESYELHHCPLENQVVDARKVELGLLFCELDRAMLQGYDRHLAFTHSCCVKLGSHSCHFVSKVQRA